MAIKLTALGRPTLLIKMSQVIARSQQFYKTLTKSSDSGWESVVQSKMTKQMFLDQLKELGVAVESSAVVDWYDRLDFDADGLEMQPTN